jgi:hypothetical protein
MEVDDKTDDAPDTRLGGSRNTSPITPDSASVPNDPTEELINATEALSLYTLQMRRAGRLPFLLRLLRRGFEHRCRLAGVPTYSGLFSRVSANVIYKCNVNSNEPLGGNSPPHRYQTRMTAWDCPLCDLHGKFKTRDMLAKHLEWDHHEVACTWKKVNEVMILATFPFVSETTLHRHGKSCLRYQNHLMTGRSEGW